MLLREKSLYSANTDRKVMLWLFKYHFILLTNSFLLMKCAEVWNNRCRKHEKTKQMQVITVVYSAKTEIQDSNFVLFY